MVYYKSMETNRLEGGLARHYNRGVPGKRKSAAERKSRVIQIRVTPAQMREMEAEAKAMGLSLSAYARYLVLRARAQRAGGK
jgi:hypothetical protein